MELYNSDDYDNYDDDNEKDNKVTEKYGIEENEEQVEIK